MAMDASLRIAHPTLVKKTDARRTWCWIITEYGTLDQARIADGRPVRDALNTPGVNLITCSKWSKDGLVRAGADPGNIALVSLGYEPRWSVPPRYAHLIELNTLRSNDTVEGYDQFIRLLDAAEKGRPPGATR